jgi:hypothetical protein
MMNRTVKYITLGTIIIICQALLSEYVNIWALLYIAIFPQFIILLPTSMNRSLYLITAFALGLCIDLFSDGILGLNAAALVAMAYSRPLILKFTLPKGNFDSNENSPLTLRTIEITSLTLITALLLTVFFAAYILIDSAASFTFGYTVLKLVVCIIANTLVSILLNLTLLDKILR